MVPTDEQQAIVNAFQTTTDNILIDAGAGCTKTSTLELIARAVRGVPILCIAFNKRIAEEMQKRMPSHCTCSTVNSVGHKAWGGFIRKRLQLDTKKTYTLIQEEVAEFSNDDKNLIFENFSEFFRSISLAKHTGYIPPGAFSGAKRLMSEEDLIDYIEEETGLEYTAVHVALLRKVMSRSIMQAFDGVIDFDDQIYMPTLFGGQWPKFQLVLVDEAQDLSKLNQEMLRKLVAKRLGAVGDPRQSIYAFRGADHRSMSRLKLAFAMREMNLTVSFRCPKAAVRLVKPHAPMLQSAPNAIEGRIVRHSAWTVDEIPNGVAVICRNRGPLFALALEFLKKARGVNVVGADIGKPLIKALKQLGPLTMLRADALTELERVTNEKLATAKSKERVMERAECLKVFLEEGNMLSEAITFAEYTFKQTDGSIILGTAHKLKGLEYDIVYYLDSWRVPSKYAETDDQLRQEANIDYVIKTRWKKELHFIDLSSMRKSNAPLY